MITMPIEIYIFCTILEILLGAITIIVILGTIEIIQEKKKEKQKIKQAIKYKKQFNNINELPTNLIYKYLSKEDKKNLLEFYERNLKKHESRNNI